MENKPLAGSDLRKTDAEVPAVREGSRVRYRFADHMEGTVVRSFRGKGGGWYVLWDGGKMIQAATENLELL
jgi:hypothetical protein